MVVYYIYYFLTLTIQTNIMNRKENNKKRTADEAFGFDYVYGIVTTGRASLSPWGNL